LPDLAAWRYFGYKIYVFGYLLAFEVVELCMITKVKIEYDGK